MEKYTVTASSSARHPSRPSLGQRTRSHGSASLTSMSGMEERVTGHDDSDLKAGRPSSELKQETRSGEQRNRSSSRGSGRVEKRIEATLPDADQPANARSRKASHVLGLFKENTTSHNIKKAPDKTKTDLNALGDRSAQRPESASVKGQEPERSHPPLVATIYEDHAESSNDRPASRFETHNNQTKADEQDQNSKQRWQKQSTGSTILLSRENGSVDRESRDAKLASPFPESVQGDRSGSEHDEANRLTVQNLPSEITANPEVATPSKEEPCTSCDGTSVTDSNPKDGDVTHQHQSALPRSVDKNARPSLLANNSEAVGEDEEESDKEHISSALYYPHQLPSPDGQEDSSTSPDGNGEGSGDTGTTQLEPLPPAALSIDVQSEDVDIALQSYNQSRYLHGDLQKSWVAPGGDANTTKVDLSTSSVSGSEYGDEDEAASSTCGEDSSHTDETGTTPTATPIAKSSFLGPRERKRRGAATAPIRAVELKPYNHQVGGHSTVFRFSRRAVCKQLSNRENEFYEVVEREHPELLRFLPRYASSHSRSYPLWCCLDAEHQQAPPVCPLRSCPTENVPANCLG